MALLDLIENPSEEERLPIEPFFGVMNEVADGAITKAQAATVLQAEPFNLAGADLTEADAWLDQLLLQAVGIDRLTYLNRSRMLCAALEQHVQGVTATYVKTRLGF